MALLLLDSFDHYADADKATKWTQAPVGSSGLLTCAIAAVGARSTNGLRLYIANSGNNNTGSLNIMLTSASGATCLCGFRFRCVTPFTANRQGTNSEATTGDLSQLVAFRYSTTTQFWLNLKTNGTLSVYRGSTLLGTTTLSLTQNVFNYIELKVVLSTTVGTVDLRVDGVSWLSLTGLNTANQGTALWDEFRIGPIGAAIFNDTTVEFNFDDLCVADGSGSDWADFKGDVRVDATYPTSDGSHSDFTLSTGATHYGTVDEALANGNTDYNYTATVNNMDTLNFPNLPVSGATIKGYQIVSQVMKTDAGAASIKAVSRIGGTDYLGTEYSVPTSYAFLRQPQAVSPATSVALTEAEYNAGEFGVKKIT